MDNAELLREFMGALARRDFDAWVQLMDPDVEFNSLIAESEAGLFRGHTGARRFLDQILSVFPDWGATLDSSEMFGDVVFMRIRFTGTGAGSGMAIEQVAWLVARARDGKVLCWRTHRTEEEARARLEDMLNEAGDAGGAD